MGQGAQGELPTNDGDDFVFHLVPNHKVLDFKRIKTERCTKRSTDLGEVSALGTTRVRTQGCTP